MVKIFHADHKKKTLFTAVIHKDADHAPTLRGCHSAVGQAHQKSLSRLNYHVRDLQQ